jgi:hypothetical protein
MGAAKRVCDLCRRQPGEPHSSSCARSRYQQARLAAQLASEGAPRWVHVSTMLVSDTEVENLGEHKIPAGGPRTDPSGVAYYLLPGETRSRRPGAGGRPARPDYARFAFRAPAVRGAA